MNNARRRNLVAAGLLILSGLIMGVEAGCAVNPVSGRPELTLIAWEPSSPTREAYLARLNGIVVGLRAADGIFRKAAFLHPDLNVFVQFPEKWPHENAPDKIVAVSPKGDAAIVLEAVANSDDPLGIASL